MKSCAALAENLRQIRMESGKTCKEFSAVLGIGKTTLYKLEKGTEEFSSATLDRIAATLGTTPAELLGGSVELSRLCEALLHTSQAVAVLHQGKREQALYYLMQLAGCWT